MISQNIILEGYISAEDLGHILSLAVWELLLCALKKGNFGLCVLSLGI